MAATPGQGLRRLLRGGLVATVAVGAGSVAHALGGGCLTVAPLIGLWLVAASASWVLAGTEVTGPMLLGWLGLTQLLTHLVLQAACAHQGAPVRHSATMTAAHLGGLAGAAAALRLGEAALWARRRLGLGMRRIARLLIALGRGLTLPPAHPRLELPSGSSAGQLPVVRVVLGGMGRRGPPVGLLLT